MEHRLLLLQPSILVELLLEEHMLMGNMLLHMHSLATLGSLMLLLHPIVLLLLMVRFAYAVAMCHIVLCYCKGHSGLALQCADVSMSH